MIMLNDIVCMLMLCDVMFWWGIILGECFVGDRWMWSIRFGRRRRCALI